MILLLPLHLSREMAEIKLASKVLFGGILAFLAIMVYLLIKTPRPVNGWAETDKNA